MTRKSISIYEPARCFVGYTLFCHTYERAATGRNGVAHVYLIDMEGHPVHEWTATTAVQLARLQPDGTLLYMTRDRSDLNSAGIYRLAPDSTVLWCYHCRADHDFQVLDNGHLIIHTLRDRMVPRLGNELRRNPTFIEITPDKSLQWEWRGEEHLNELAALVNLEIPIDWERRMDEEIAERLSWDTRLQGLTADEMTAAKAALVRQRSFDWAHNNTCHVLPENAAGVHDGRFRAGNILFSYRSLDIIGIIDRETAAIVWAWGPGVLDGQHQPSMLPSGHILVYDNGARRGWSQVLELDPLTGEIAWRYTATPRRAFFAPFISGAQRLPNGNTLICEGASGGRLDGRLFEVTSEKEIVWEYRSPYTDPGTYGIYRAQRYSPEYVEPLLAWSREAHRC